MNKAYKSYYCNEFQDRNINCDNNEHITKKIILNKRSDLLNIPIHQLRTARLKNFSGKLFEQIYKEAISIEYNQNIYINKSFSDEVAYKNLLNNKDIILNNYEDTYAKNRAKTIKIINKKPQKNIKYDINSINFEIKYDTKYGEEIGVLGSNNELGFWNINNIFYLNWNDGNIWKGKIYVNKPYINFEFKFVLCSCRNIKFWENGDNNKINFDEILNDIKTKKNGKLNKCEYFYDGINKELCLKCNWN